MEMNVRYENIILYNIAIVNRIIVLIDLNGRTINNEALCQIFAKWLIIMPKFLPDSFGPE